MPLMFDEFEDLTQRICANLQALLELRGMTKSDLAKKSGKWPSFIQSVFSGDCGHTTRTLLQMADALNADLIVELRPRKGEK